MRQDVDELSVIVNDAIRLRRFAHFVGLKRRYVCKVASYDVLIGFRPRRLDSLKYYSSIPISVTRLGYFLWSW